MNAISDLLFEFQQMRYQIRGIVKYFHLILQINFRSKILSFLQRNHEISIFAIEKANLSATQWYIKFSSILIQIDSAKL